MWVVKINISEGCSFLIILSIIFLLSCTIAFSSLVPVAAIEAVNPNTSNKTASYCTGSFKFVPDFLPYLNPDTGLQLEYPTNWKSVEYVDGVKFASPFENASYSVTTSLISTPIDQPSEMMWCIVNDNT